jgi:hypothetical protein
MEVSGQLLLHRANFWREQSTQIKFGCIITNRRVKLKSMAWKRLTSPVVKKFESQPSAGKIMLTIFWDMGCAILVKLTPKGETVNSQNSMCLAQ